MTRPLLALLCVLLPVMAGCAPVAFVQPTPQRRAEAAFEWPARFGAFEHNEKGVVYEDIRILYDWQSGRIPNDFVLPPDEIDLEQIQLLVSSAIEPLPEELTPQLEIGGGFIVRPLEGQHASAPGEHRQYLAFVSGERDNLTSSLAIQRTWFTFAEPEGVRPRGLAILMPGMFATPREVSDRAERGLLMRGWAVLRMLSPPSRMTQRTVYSIPLDRDNSAVMRRIARDLDNRVAECAYAVKAAADHVVRGSRTLPGAPRVIIGMSGSAIALPTIVAHEPEAYDAAVIIAGGANSFSIARRSSYRDWIDSVGFEFTPIAPTNAELAAIDDAYLAHSTLDGAHTASAMQHIPTLMIHGSTDTAVPSDSGDLLWERLGKVERWVMPVGHELVFAAIPLRLVGILDWIDAQTASKE